MASSGGALNLSLLSRGIGEISKNGHEKIDVVFEPQDYFNFVGNSSRIYLPPIPKYDFDGLPSSTKSSHFKSQSSQEIPKTFTTRKGALLLYSEDQAHKVLSSHHDFKKARHRRPHPTEETLELSKSADELELKTVDDLAKSILSFGKREPTNDDTDIYLGFIHNTYGRRKKDLFERQIRPGFSAKRYLSLWTKSWDDNVLGKVISKGYLTEKSLFYYNPLNPHLQRRLNDDMSHFPAPYKLMRSMLMSPGSLSGYTFYRVRPESAETVVTPEQQPERTPSQMGSIKVISTKDGVQKEVSYSTLDKVAQEEVLTDLLVKSAVHYAMKKQQELMEGNQREEAIQEVDENRSSVQQFDMRDAVESLLDSQKSKGVLNTDFPEDKSEASSRSGSIKGKTLKRRSKDKDSESSRATSPLPFDNAESEKEYVGSVPVASVRGDQSSVPQLPHISGAMPLTPIGEASREGTRMTIPVSLPPIGQDQGIDGVPMLTVIPPTPQHSSLTASPTKMVKDSQLLPQDEGNEEFSDESGVGVKTERTERHYGEDTERKRRVRRIKAENTGPSVSGGYHLHSSTESLGGPSSAHSLPTAKPLRTHWKGSTQSLKSDRSKKGSSSLPEDSNKGSIVIGPDGEPISVGGHIEVHTRPEQQHIENVGDANRYFGRETESKIKEEETEGQKSVEENPVSEQDLISDQESDDEPDVWKRRRGVQREDMRNYAHKREIDYTGGDIDATLSINSWSYIPKDTDPEFAGIVNQMNRASSLPGLPFRSGSGQSLQSQQISEKDIINVLEDTARNIAASTLSRSDSGQDLEKDARQAAELWLEKNAPRIISRSQSVQDTQGDQAAIRSAVENGRKSAGPTAGEYKDLIKEKLQTALSNTDGESIPQIPDDAELSPELLEALKNNSITPEDIEIVKDEETGKSIVRSRSQMSAAMGGVKEGHIYVPVAKNGNKQHGTIPTDRQSIADLGEIEVINYGARSSDAGSKVGSARTHSSKKSEKLSDKAPSEKSSEKGGKSQPPSVLGESIVEEDEQEDMKSQRSGGQMSQEEVEEPEDEFKKALVEVEKVNEAEQKDLGRQSVVSKKSEKSAVSDKKSAVSDDKKSVQTEKSDAKKAVAKKEEFVVGMVKNKNENEALYGGISPPPKGATPPNEEDKGSQAQSDGKVNTKGELEKLFGELGLPPNKPTTKKKGKPKDKGKKAPAKKPGKATKGKKAKDEEPKPTPAEEPPTEEAPPKEPTPPPSLPPLEDKGASDNESDKESIAETAKSSESDFEFHFVRETPSPSPPPPPKAPSTIPSVDDEPTDDDEKQDGEDDEAARLRMISNREARAAKRAAQAAKRKEDVERKRREKEEQARRERDEHERAEQLKREMEAERRKTLDAKRQRKMEEDEEREREAQQEEEKMAKQKAEVEKERRRKEEYQRKLEEMKRKQAEEEQKRYEEMLEKQREEEERRKEEEEMMAKMAEEERLEYERKKKLEEEERKRKEEEDKIRREEEAKRAMEEARKLAEEMARKQAEMEARLKFNRTLQVEARGLDHSHNITEAFVFSYFELLNWFGLDVPEFELLKLNQY
ncbi:uncharacterized protein KIAA2012 homolog isoform X6 [Mytilus trossulus]|uniref:uncharacterized protein KIAA2012 homolog isoform X6 n=1 Tax=Mytilus trossulus TaxID=6551 RepID=UPI003007D4B5